MTNYCCHGIALRDCEQCSRGLAGEKQLMTDTDRQDEDGPLPYSGPITIDASLLHALWCYGSLNPVTGVVYSYGTHQKALDDVDKTICERARGPTRDAAEGATPIGEDTPYWRALRAALVLPVEEQHAIAKDLAANCGYELTGDAYTATPQPAPDAMRSEIALADFKRRCQLYLDDAPADGRHSDVAGSNAYELIQEAIYQCSVSAPVPPADGAGEADHLTNWVIGYLGRECGLIVSEISAGDRANVVNAIRNSLTAIRGGVSPDLLQAGRDLIATPGIHKIRVSGQGSELLSRDEIFSRIIEARASIPPSATEAAEPGNAQMVEYARRLNDIATDCEMATGLSAADWRGHASDLYRIAEQIGRVAIPPVRGDREILRRISEFCSDDANKLGAIKRLAEIQRLANGALADPVQPGAGERDEMPRDLSDGLPHLNRNE